MENARDLQFMGEAERLARTWALRAIMHPRAFQRFSKVSFVHGEEEILKITGLERIIEKQFNQHTLYQFASSELDNLSTVRNLPKEPIIYNIEKLGNLIKLSEIEKEILLFASLLQIYPGLKEAVEYLGESNFQQFIKNLSFVLRREEYQIYEALKDNSPLCSSGLIDLNRRRFTLDMGDRLEVLDGLVHMLQDPHADLDDSLNTFFHKAPSSDLDILDFAYLGEDLTILQAYLKYSLQSGVSGVNILVYGPPGTGKTELVRSMARHLGVCLYEVSCQDQDGEPSQGNQRFRSYLLCQSLFAHRRECLILFDEIEDVFPKEMSSFFGPVSRSGRHKGWTNRLMENNQVPAIWISNCITQIDPAFLRRFDFTLEVPVPPDTVRQQILLKMLSGMAVNKDWLDAMGKNPHLAPGHMEKAIKVASVAGVNEDAPRERIISRVVSNLQKAMGLPPHRPSTRRTQIDYELAFLNTDFPMDRVIEICRQEPVLSICLHGPSGTGKTAFVHYLSEKLQKKIITRKASEILGPYVGQTEQHLAEMFAQAHDPDRVLLFLDEADSFLQDRSRARYSWEITNVNELLVLMENFEGLFICATNLIETLDKAVFRRFDLKIKFDFLTQDQAWRLFVKMLARHDLDIPSDQESRLKSRLRKISKLTPADFLLAERQLRFAGGDKSPCLFLATLERESLYKYGTFKYPVGF